MKPDAIADPQPARTVRPSKKPFFSRLDWAAFWTATLIAFGVYVLTLPPAVTLEDSGEFAVAGDWLGVPHPPGYPFWTTLAWVFARLFSFVTFRGQPNPAWGIALLSAVCGALATGVTAMLITRSSADMLRDSRGEAADLPTEAARQTPWICGVAGVSASLLFAFSPVMWSQSVIIEAYSLNALFLMLIFLMTYRWMRRPTDKLLWLTGFVFGLGLTNYQVLLLAAAPLAIVILLRDIGLFRDFILLGLPFGVIIVILQLGALPAATPGFPKHPPLPALRDVADPLAAPRFRPLIAPAHYIWVAVLVTLVIAACVVAVMLRRRAATRASVRIAQGVAGVCFLALLIYLHSALPAPPPPVQAQPGVEVFNWLPYQAGFALAVVVLLALCVTLPSGPMYALSVLAIQWALAVLLYRGALLGLTHPASLWFQAYVALNFVLLALGAFMLPRGIAASMTFLTVQAGAAYYAYMPIVSDLRNPPMNWGYPRTWEGFKHAITRGQYEKIAPTDIFSTRFISQLGDYFTDLRTQFTLMIAPVAMLPFLVWRFRYAHRRFSALKTGIVLFLISATYVGIGEFLGWEDRGVFRLDKVVLSMMLLLMVAGGMVILLNAIDSYVHNAFDRERHVSERIMAAFSLAGAALAVAFFLYRLLLWLFDADAGGQAGLRLLAVLAAVVVSVVLLAGSWILKRALERETDLRFMLSPLTQRWLIATTVGFLMMSVLLVALANPTGDLQDLFIQKVKFISSHALFALWIGYGLVFGLIFVADLVGPRRWLFQGALVLTALLPLLPIEQNYFNPELIRVYGAADQTGHDFGWQFGNYQLRGAEAIMEELDPFEEPLPNPFYPPAMTPRAIFFGGTDPGRFVPTYMIFSARVREDVYLITQNALADNTFMSVTRDLYGDEIWIPTPEDNARAFSIYVEEVQSGKRPRNAQLVIQDGRVQVFGALGVMEINGILCEMIFKQNRERHDFYVEESYVIPWMYPYMTPHGLILKLNDNQTLIAETNRRDDLDFWDWYARRLLDNRRFRRDIAAQKSFSKLRSAIAGLYASRNMHREAEQAFTESHLLYRESPEAIVRLVNEIWLPQQRFDDALDLLGEFRRRDPNNKRTPQFIADIEHRRDLTDRLRAIVEAAHPERGLTTEQALELAGIYAEFGNRGQVLQVLAPMLNVSGVDGETLFASAMLLRRVNHHREAANFIDQALDRLQPATAEQLLTAARIYGQAGMPDKMLMPLRQYLQLHPSDWQAWLDLATLYQMRGEIAQAQSALHRAIQIRGMEAVNTIRHNPNLREIGEPVIRNVMQGGRGGSGTFRLPQPPPSGR